jgi:hypothetical protein
MWGGGSHLHILSNNKENSKHNAGTKLKNFKIGETLVVPVTTQISRTDTTAPSTSALQTKGGQEIIFLRIF